MEFVVKGPEPIVVRVGDKSYHVKRPTVNDAEKLNLRIKNKGEDSDIVIMKEYLCGLGLPVEVIGEWTIETLSEFVDLITTPKKK